MFPSCAYTDASPVVGSRVGREPSQSLEAWHLVLVLRWVGATGILYCILFYNILSSHVVLFVSTVIFVIVLLCVYYIERSSTMLNCMYITINNVIVP